MALDVNYSMDREWAFFFREQSNMSDTLDVVRILIERWCKYGIFLEFFCCNAKMEEF